jgi:hypothetical protein
LNTIYMSSYFAGGAAIGSLAWQHFGWAGLCAFGLALFATALVVLGRSNTSTIVQSILPRRTPRGCHELGPSSSARLARINYAEQLA